MELAVLQQTRHYFRASTVQNETDRNWRHTCKISMPQLSIWHVEFGSAAVLVVITAFMPCMVVIVPMVIAIIIAIRWHNDAAASDGDQCQ